MKMPDEEAPILQSGGEPLTLRSRCKRTFRKYLRPHFCELNAALYYVFIGITASSSTDPLIIAVAHGLTYAIMVAAFKGIRCVTVISNLTRDSIHLMN
jgi:hypothetical protein